LRINKSSTPIILTEELKQFLLLENTMVLSKHYGA